MKDLITSSFLKEKLQPTNLAKYNRCPERLTEIGEQRFMSNLFYYCFAKMESRQVRQGISFKLRMFPLEYLNRKNMGFAILEQWRDLDTRERLKQIKYRYMRYGDEKAWRDFEAHFASQFKGDNS